MHNFKKLSAIRKTYVVTINRKVYGVTHTFVHQASGFIDLEVRGVSFQSNFDTISLSFGHRLTDRDMYFMKVYFHTKDGSLWLKFLEYLYNNNNLRWCNFLPERPLSKCPDFEGGKHNWTLDLAHLKLKESKRNTPRNFDIWTHYNNTARHFWHYRCGKMIKTNLITVRLMMLFPNKMFSKSCCCKF